MIFLNLRSLSGRILWLQNKPLPVHGHPVPHSGRGRLDVGFGGGFMREAIMAYPNRVDKSKQQKFKKVKSNQYINSIFFEKLILLINWTFL